MTRSPEEPRGARERTPRSVYVRRRIAVFAALIACLAIIVMLIAGPQRVSGWFGGGDSASGEGTSGESEASGPATAAPGAQVPGAEPEEPREPGPCDVAKLGVEAVTDKTSYGGQDTPLLSLRITNHDDIACDADLGTQTQILVVTSGSEVYWDSRHCQTNPEPTLVRMEPGQSLETEPFAWDRSRSTPETCDADDRPRVPGAGVSYHLNVEIAGAQSANTRQFLLY